jgi:hypothetical protein
LNTELPEELGSLLNTDILVSSTSTTAVTQNGVGMTDVSQQPVQQHQLLHNVQLQQQQQQHDTGMQNHQQLTHLLSANMVSTFSSATVSHSAPRYTSIGIVSTQASAGTNSMNVLNPQLGGLGARVSLAGLNLGAGTNSILTIHRQGNIALLPAGSQGLGTVGVQRASLQAQPTQHLNPSSGIVNSGGTAMLTVGTSNGATTIARLMGVNAAAAGMVINVQQNQAGQSTSVLTTNGTHLAPTLAVMQRNPTPQRFSTASLQQPVVGDTNIGAVAVANTSQLGLPATGIASATSIGVRVSVWGLAIYFIGIALQLVFHWLKTVV